MAEGGSDHMKEVFNQYAGFGKTEMQKKKGSDLTMKDNNVQKMFKENGVYTKVKGLKSQDVDTAFMKVCAKPAKTINFDGFMQLLDQIAADKTKKDEEKKAAMSDKLKGIFSEAKGPGTGSATKTVKAGGVDRLTDTTKYTGSHKERFDDSGKGKGKEGRKDEVSGDGYVQGYKEKGGYDEKH